MRIKLLLFALAAFASLYASFSFSVNYHKEHNQLPAPYNGETTAPVATTPPQTGSLLYVSNVSGNQEIYKLDLATKKTENLTNTEGDDMNPQLSPDKSHIVFYSNIDGDNEIFTMDLTSKEVVQLTKNTAGDYDPTYSIDGKSIVYKSNIDDGKGDIFLMRADGSGQINLTKKMIETEEWDPTFTQDGQRIVFVSRAGEDHIQDEIYIMQADGSNLVQLTENRVPDWYPSIHPTEKDILFISKQSPLDGDDVFEMSETGEKRVRKTELEGNDDDPAYSLDGSHIVFINNSDGDYDLYIMKRDGSEVKKIMNTDHDELSPIFFES